jgi:hypothetical protein
MRWAQRVSSQSAVCRRSGDKVANRTVGIFGREIEMSSSHRFATPAQHHCSPYRRIHVRYERLGVVARSRGSFSRPCQTLLVRFATFSHIAVHHAPVCTAASMVDHSASVSPSLRVPAAGSPPPPSLNCAAADARPSTRVSSCEAEQRRRQGCREVGAGRVPLW